MYKKSKSEGLFYFTAKKKGTYSFILSNHRQAQFLARNLGCCIDIGISQLSLVLL